MTAWRTWRAGLVAMTCLATVAAAAEESPIVRWGKEIYGQRCAACHGEDGGGAGPAASALKTGPSDLRQIRRAHDGKFPFLWLVGFIDGERPVAAHGAREMPVWGQIFRWANGDYGARAQIYALTQYLESIQQ